MMDQLYRREFLVRTLLTFDAAYLISATGFNPDELVSMCLGHTAITQSQVEKIYNALKLVK
ncbi:hypothetical protein [Acinetobacter radioresistens]|jgi:hypothetical protein|uniref:hypothetical protein n=1 Tax=Acinetobacter radioresistens TaxID=40216 RepID=UPI0002CFD666|nr:hypothetical protein [Acinetobacter radioresistens]ENV88173.1 hypothetical protein F940_00019 [Acinetobacter radioresistens NIPH 2130]EXB80142.1 hypothetical protein J538_3063 [Acinetobacter sp. 272263]MCK4084876.1 hypothetical protein [Acinetobacter radioresistens]MCU4622780.1 hypothetical protein [Acinetobacter radioresistens]MCX0349050.1 hypothetical protein [Acinetobacter radioresistens]